MHFSINRGGGQGAAPPGALEGCMKSRKFRKHSAKKEAGLKLCEFAARTVTLAALDIDAEGGEVPMFAPMGEATLARIRSCAAWVEFAVPEGFAKLKKIKGYVCRNAFCPVCAAYQARRDGLKLAAMMAAMQDLKRAAGAGGVAGLFGPEVAALPEVAKAAAQGAEFALATLTAPNVGGAALKAEERRYAKAFDLLVKNWLAREHGGHYLGYARKLEVTYNAERRITKAMWEGGGKYRAPGKWKYKRLGLGIGDPNPDYDTYHPHYHVLLAVAPGFFDGAGRPAVSREALLGKWRGLMGCPAITQVDIAKAGAGPGGGGSAALEIAKYVAKDSDMLHSPKVFKVFYESLKGCKRLTMGGLFQVMHRLFKAGELDRYVPPDEAAYKWALAYGWGGAGGPGGYAPEGGRELSPEEAAKVRGMKYSEANDTEEF